MTPEEVNSIIERNKKHRQQLFASYDPLTGIGSPIARHPLYLDKAHSQEVFLPHWLYNSGPISQIVQCGDMESFCEQNNLSIKAMHEVFHKLRCKYDFEYWAATCGKIKNKADGTMINLRCNRGQRKLLATLLTDFFAGLPVRIILLKARQWGGSTLVQLFFAWVQIFHRENWNSVIVAHQKDPARNIRAMYSRMASHHPTEIAPVKLKNFEGSSSNKELVGRGAVISVGTAEKPEALRSDDIKMAHFSEVGLYKRTKEKSPEDLIQAIVSSIPNTIPHTIIVMESTAKGVGNFFYDEWQRAEAKESAYKPVFVAWWELEQYYKPFADDAERLEFVRTMSDVEVYRFNLGATLEGLNWYREKRKEVSTDIAMMNEFPSTPAEAFAASQSYAHNPLHLQAMKEFCKEPLAEGELIADTSFGPTCIGSSLQFVPTPGGNLRIWAYPDKSKPIKNRYVVSLDIGGRSDSADWSVASVIDRYYLMKGGVEQRVATYRYHADQDIAVWRAVQLAKWYNDALFAPEANSADIKGMEGDHTLTIFDEIKPHYFNIFARTDPQRIKEGKRQKLGFHTNKATKTDLVNQYNKRIREAQYIEFDLRAIAEAEQYEIKPDGSYGNIEGRDKHDDIHMSTMIALKVSQLMPLPEEARATYISHISNTARGIAEM